MRFNINFYVKVKLNEYGKEILFRQFEKRHEKFPKVFREFILPDEDEEGWSKWQLWNLMATFGEYMSLGREVPFDTEIEIMEPK